MNLGGSQGPSPAQQVQERIYLDQARAYIKNQLPALSATIRRTEHDEPGLEDMAAGEAGASARSKVSDVLAGDLDETTKRGVSTGSSNFILRSADVMGRGAGLEGQSADAGRRTQKGIYYGDLGGIVGIGDSMLNQANEGLATAGGIQSGSAALAKQRTAQNVQGAATVATTAAMLVAAFA